MISVRSYQKIEVRKYPQRNIIEKIDACIKSIIGKDYFDHVAVKYALAD